MRHIYNNGMARNLLGRQIKDLRQSHNDAQYEMASRLGITVSKLSAIECGRRAATRKDLAKLESAYGMKVVENELGELTLEKE